MSASIDQLIGEKVKLIRMQRNVAILQLASTLSMSENDLKRIEAGELRLLPEQIVTISEFLEIDIRFFFERWFDFTAIEPKNEK